VKHLADGGMAQVLLARATGIEGFERHVVLKRIHEDRAKDPTFVKMFLDEARLAGALHHTNIVQVHDIGEQGGEYFFAMEYVHGEDLRKLLMTLSEKHAQIPLAHVVTIIMAAASALHYAHELCGSDRKPIGLVHRDVSPANILVGYDGTVKVVDFGIAKAALRSTETISGMLKGKVAYMAPEQCSGKPVDRRSDVFALGVVLYELTTVRRLFKGDNDFLTMTAIVQGNIPKPSKHREDLPAELERIILKALSQEPGDRFQTAEEMRAALDQFAADANLRTSNAGLAIYLEQQFGKRIEPWLIESSHPEVSIVDFDGSASGVAPIPEAGDAAFAVVDAIGAQPGAPIERARNKAVTGAPLASHTSPPTTVLPPPPPPVRKTPVSGVPVTMATAQPVESDKARALGDSIAVLAGGDAPATTTAPVTEWPNGTDATVQPAPRGKRIAIAAGVIGIALVIIIAVRFAGGGSSEPTEPPARAVDHHVDQPVAPPPRVEPPRVEPPRVEPPRVTATGSAAGSDVPSAGSATEPVAAGSGSAAPVKKKRDTKKKRPTVWNPDELYPK
jgi:serine/threonine protein kinase